MNKYFEKIQELENKCKDCPIKPLMLVYQPDVNDKTAEDKTNNRFVDMNKVEYVMLLSNQEIRIALSNNWMKYQHN